jgi:sulfonate transport system permease protein
MTRQRGAKEWQAKLLTFALLAIAWEVAARAKNSPQLYPTFGYLFGVSLPSLGMFSQVPSASIAAALATIVRNGLITLARIAAGLAIGMPCGIIGGLVLHYLRGSGQVSALTLTAVRSTPMLALIPLFQYWFGLSSAAIVAYIALGTFFVIASDAYEAAANMAPVYVQQARLLGASSAFILWTVYLPGILSQLSGGLRNVIGLSWAFSLGAEYISASDGLGYVTFQAYSNSNMGQLVLMALLYAVAGYGSYESTQLVVRFFTGSSESSQDG